MGIYRHLSVSELQATRARLMASLQDRLTAPTSAAHNGRSVQYQQNVAEIRKEIAAVGEELDRRSGGSSRGPIYMV
ncbi:hypothetical protein [Variovorax atrisoli]|uniref:hypothetical protein n=1 Tax=Variovorax atrisoli TaxID=3394203 RepID=UPI0016492283|nr:MULTISPECIES: hypothetical protein [Variovorax]MBB3641163.1 hypothetical protein [Variovorax sp. BK613]